LRWKVPLTTGVIGRTIDDYHSQPSAWFRMMTPEQQQTLFENTARAIGDAAQEIMIRHISNCAKVDPACCEGCPAIPSKRFACHPYVPRPYSGVPALVVASVRGATFLWASWSHPANPSIIRSNAVRPASAGLRRRGRNHRDHQPAGSLFIGCRRHPDTDSRGGLYVVVGTVPTSAGQTVWVIETARGASANVPVRLDTRGNLMTHVTHMRPEHGPFRSYLAVVLQDGSTVPISRKIDMKTP
jgi:hypothetical protein